MTLVVDLPIPLQSELMIAAEQRGLALPEYVLQILTRWRILDAEEPIISRRDQIDHILAASGRVFVPQPAISSSPNVRHTPVPITGQPVSEIAIEQRG